MTAPELVSLTIDGHELHVPKGANLIQVAQDHGHYIPRFCWHERMKPVGMCRQCLVEVEGVRGLPPACTTTVTPDMKVKTQETSLTARKAQEGVLEFLLINHPLDCPVCDRGGECPLQDHTIAHGPGESRFVEEKRHFAKPIPISDLVDLDRERCILCARCTRFADEIAGDPLISFVERGGDSQVLTYPDDPFTSYFSGNTVQICPVGALTARPYRFRARPWDLEKVETSCTVCAVQCRTELHSTTNQLVRLLGVDSEAVNQGWLCDKGRFGYEWIHSPQRVTSPMVRRTTGEGQSDLVAVSWPEALDAAAEGLRDVLRMHGPTSLGVIGGARGSNEDAYVWARLAKSVWKTDNVDCQLDDGLPAEVVLGLPRATIGDCDRAKAVILLGPDLKEELPVLFLRLRRAALELGVPLIEVGPVDTGLSRYATARIRHLPGGAADAIDRLLAAGRQPGSATGDAGLDAAAQALAGDRPGDVVVVLGRPNLAESADATVAAAGRLAEALPGVTFLSALRRGNVHGALDMGLAPGFLPGRVALSAAAAVPSGWGAAPEDTGLDAQEMLLAAASGRLHGLVLLGSDPVADFPDRGLAERAVAAAGFVVAVDGFLTESTRRADVVLPPALWGEKHGSSTNIEGRVSRLNRKVTPAGVSMDDWRIAAELALRFDADFDLETVDEVQDEIARVAPAYRGVEPHVIRGARDGVMVPMTEVPLLVSGPKAAGADLGNVDSSVPQTGAADPDAGRNPAPAEDAPDTAESSLEPGHAADVTPVAPTASPTPLYRWTPAAASAPAIPADGYAWRLVVGRKLWDEGLVVSHGPSIAHLAEPAALFVNPFDQERLGVADGATVRVTSDRGSVTLPVRGSAAVPKGVAWLPHRQPGGDVDLVDVSRPVTDLRVETVR